MVVIEARHLCVEMRGVKKPGALTTTSALRGCFADREVREEFLALIRRQVSW
jgi:GTP cyclohydrolase I